jgi:hypothetical protein
MLMKGWRAFVDEDQGNGEVLAQECSISGK